MIKYYLAAQFPRYLASRLRLVGASGSEQNLSSVTSDTVWKGVAISTNYSLCEVRWCITLRLSNTQTDLTASVYSVAGERSVNW